MIYRTAHTANFTVLPNAIFNNPNLSGNAKALLSYLLSKPTHWKVRITDLQNVLKVGRDRVYRYLHELIDAGYAKMTLIQKGVRWEFFDTPQSNQTSDTAKPEPKFHLPDRQHAERQQALERNEVLLLVNNEEQQQAATISESTQPAEAPSVVVPFENKKLDDPIQKTEMASFKAPEPAPAVLPECDNAIPDNRLTADPIIVAEVEKLPIAATIKPTLIKTLAALTLIEAKAVLMILTRAISLGKVQNPAGYAVQLVRAAQNGTLTVNTAHQPLTSAERIAKEKRQREEESQRGAMDNATWAKWFESRTGVKPQL